MAIYVMDTLTVMTGQMKLSAAVSECAGDTYTCILTHQRKEDIWTFILYIAFGYFIKLGNFHSL